MIVLSDLSVNEIWYRNINIIYCRIVNSHSYLQDIYYLRVDVDIKKYRICVNVDNENNTA